MPPALLALALASRLAAQSLDPGSLWPSSYPALGTESARPQLTKLVRRKRKTLGLDGIEGLRGEKVSKAVALFPKARERAGLLVFELESGPERGVHACEALGRGKTSLAPQPGWTSGVIEEPGGRKTAIYYAPGELEGGATLPGIYELRNIRTKDYDIKLLNKDLAGDEALARRLMSGDSPERPYFSGVWKTWYPRDPRYADVVPVDMIWSEAYQKESPGAAFPVYEYKGESLKDPLQLRHNPRYYYGPFGRSGFAVHTDRWEDEETSADPKLADKNERRSFLFRDTNGCVKLRPDCLLLLNAFIDEQAARGRRVLLEARELL